MPNTKFMCEVNPEHVWIETFNPNHVNYGVCPHCPGRVIGLPVKDPNDRGAAKPGDKGWAERKADEYLKDFEFRGTGLLYRRIKEAFMAGYAARMIDEWLE